MDNNINKSSDTLKETSHPIKIRISWSLLITTIIYLKSFGYVLFHHESYFDIFTGTGTSRQPYGRGYDFVESFSDGAAWPHPSFLLLGLIAIIVAVFELLRKRYSRNVKIGASVSIVLNLIYYVIIFVFIYFWAQLAFHQ